MEKSAKYLKGCFRRDMGGVVEADRLDSEWRRESRDTEATGMEAYKGISEAPCTEGTLLRPGRALKLVSRKLARIMMKASCFLPKVNGLASYRHGD